MFTVLKSSENGVFGSPGVEDFLPAVKEVQTKLLENKIISGLNPSLLLVGGVCRDFFFDVEPKDIDLELTVDSIPEASNELFKIFGNQIHLESEILGLYKINIDSDTEIELKLRQRNVPNYEGQLEHSVYQRDFTINSIAFDLTSNLLIDPLNGVEDIQNKVLKSINPEDIVNDPIRIFRGMQLFARLGLGEIEQVTAKCMSEVAGQLEISTLNREQLVRNFTKLFLAEKPSIGLEFLRQIDSLGVLSDMIKNLPETPQDKTWHPEGNVWVHTLLAVDAAAKIINRPESDFNREEKIIILLSVFLHDIGKAVTTETKNIDGKIKVTSHGHESAGAKEAIEVVQKMGFSKKIAKKVAKLVHAHMKLNEIEKFSKSPERYANEIRKILKGLHPVSLNVYCALLEADKRGRGGNANTEEGISKINFFKEQAVLRGYDRDPKRNLLSIADIENLKIDLSLYPSIILEVEHLRDSGRFSSPNKALSYIKNKYFITTSDLDSLGVYEGSKRKDIFMEFKKLLKNNVLSSRDESLAWLNKYILGDMAKE